MPQFYDPERLVTEIQAHLWAHGIDAQTQDWHLAWEGACKLLRGLGITPGLEPVNGLAKAAAEPWTDTDDRRAAAEQGKLEGPGPEPSRSQGRLQR